MKRVALGFTGAHASTDTYLDGASYAEERGYESIWFAEDYFLRDTVTLATATATATSDLNLGLFVNPYTRSPALTAMTAASLHEIADADVEITVGAGPPMVMERMVDYGNPVAAVKESVDLMRELLDGENVSYDGRRFEYDDISIGECEYMPYFDRFDPPGRTPMYVAATGPQMLKMAGDVGDGLAISVGYTPSMVEDAIDRVRDGLAIRDRDPSSYEVNAFLFTADRITDRARQFTALNVAVVRNDEELAEMGFDEADVAAVRDRFQSAGVEAAADEVTDWMVKEFVLTGDRTECHRRLDEFAEAGVDLPILLHLGKSDVEATVDIGASWAEER